jgi:hypothetical protein
MMINQAFAIKKKPWLDFFETSIKMIAQLSPIDKQQHGCTIHPAKLQLDFSPLRGY